MAVTDSHVVYDNRRHGTSWVDRDALYSDPTASSYFCQQLAVMFVRAEVEVVAVPMIGGAVLSHLVATHLMAYGRKPRVTAVYAERAGRRNTFEFRRGYDKHVVGKKTLVVCNVLSTGRSAKGVVRAVRDVGGQVVGVGALCNIGGVTMKSVEDPPPMHVLIDMDSWPEEDCPLCKDGIPVNMDVGHEKEFLARKQK